VCRSLSAILVLGGGIFATELIPRPPLPELSVDSLSRLVVIYLMRPSYYEIISGFYTTIIEG
jgi:hypothetical protein